MYPQWSEKGKKEKKKGRHLGTFWFSSTNAYDKIKMLPTKKNDLKHDTDFFFKCWN